ncbi:MAG: GDP-L-fucose synthase [Deltaproteobacteria bacterium]|nr:GDP-L-fucose synthase [Deltaproteobacteria bacterium]
MSSSAQNKEDAALDLQDCTFAVTGGAGFLGSFVNEELEKRGVQASSVHNLRSADFDLRIKSEVAHMYEKIQPDVVIHLAAVVGGIGANKDNPGRFLYENLVMATELIEEGRLYDKLKKFVGVGTICAYPKFTPVPFKEEELWNGYPEETNAPYGLAKKMMLAQIQAYAEQYDFPGIYLLPVNLYGPRDNFNLHSSHVIPALIRKIEAAMAANADDVTLWGDGSPTREFIHARDAALGIVKATEAYDSTEPVNIGTGKEISIKHLAETLGRLMGFKGAFHWDSDKPNGQPRRMLDVTRAKERFGFSSAISFEEGLAETISWWREHRFLVEAAENEASN